MLTASAFVKCCTRGRQRSSVSCRHFWRPVAVPTRGGWALDLDAVNAVVQSAAGADALFIPDGSDAADIVQSLADARVNVKRLQLLGSGLWDDPSVAAAQSLQGGAYPAPEPAGYRSFAQRYRKRFNQDPVRTATLSYDAVALVAALVKTHGAQRFSEETLTASSGFAADSRCTIELA